MNQPQQATNCDPLRHLSAARKIRKSRFDNDGENFFEIKKRPSHEDEVNIDEYDNEIEVIRLDDNSRQLVSIPADHTVERKSRMMS